MMDGHEKSDLAIVAVKPANKAEPDVEQSTAEPTAAEPVEPRAGTKGNADQQSTCRTQRRVSVSQALERIRKVARERKKEKFLHLLTAACVLCAVCRFSDAGSTDLTTRCADRRPKRAKARKARNRGGG